MIPPARYTNTSLSSGFNLSTASYDNVSFSVASQETVTTGVVFNADGTKMYTVGYTTDNVLCNIPYQQLMILALPLTIVLALVWLVRILHLPGIRFNADFTKMYISGNTNDTVYQYSIGA